MCVTVQHVVPCTATKIPFIFLFWELCGLSLNFHIHVSVRDLYIYRIGPLFSCSRIGRSIMGIYKSLTDTWMWKLRLWPRNSFSGNICFQFLVLVLCSVCTHNIRRADLQKTGTRTKTICLIRLIHSLWSEVLDISSGLRSAQSLGIIYTRVRAEKVTDRRQKDAHIPDRHLWGVRGI
jgi:hypothetical protein